MADKGLSSETEQSPPPPRTLLSTDWSLEQLNLWPNRLDSRQHGADYGMSPRSFCLQSFKEDKGIKVRKRGRWMDGWMDLNFQPKHYGFKKPIKDGEDPHVDKTNRSHW